MSADGLSSTLNGSVLAEFTDEFGNVLGRMTPESLSVVSSDNPADYVEVDFLLRSVLACGGRYRMISLGASPGEWTIRADRACAKRWPDCDYLSLSVEADPVHLRIMYDYFINNSVDEKRNVMVYGAVGPKDGFSYLPIVAQNNWGAGVVAFSDEKAGSANIDVPEHKKVGHLSDTNRTELTYRCVMTFGLDSLIERVGLTDFLHVDIQHNEIDVLPPHIEMLGRSVKVCCISVHSSEITKQLKAAFDNGEWRLARDIPGHFIQGPHGEENHKDGVLIFINNSLCRGDGAIFD
ncbi:hypothetical protein LNAOJCKE_2977 [Methylorubrum aminovorans]|uniref:Methyltransferase FkbM domain-containing protein n=2 Tax=Methylorubrum aminovorans TaxID=269069 RepID=A0ABQ4UF81_9HYPH|nr:hypothetical protein LNAOJCKE_2977 [Methylorubrum aminovorans]